jgi:hypothetical protein
LSPDNYHNYTFFSRQELPLRSQIQRFRSMSAGSACQKTSVAAALTLPRVY